jgi:hypothetical protein
LHELLDKLHGVRDDVGRRIAELMANLAEAFGYEHPERIRQDSEAATEWFYVYANEQLVLRNYAFELWEGYYVGPYLSLASALSLLVCIGLWFFSQSRIAISFACLSSFVFVAGLAVRHWSTIPRIIGTPARQVAQIHPSGEILSEARRRFG